MVAARRTSLLLIPLHRVRADSDDRRCLEIGVSPDLPSGLIAIEDGKLDVHEDEVGPPRLRLGHTVPSGSPYMRLHRWDLQHAMMMRLAEIAPGALRLGSGVDRLEHGGAGVTLRFTDGHTETADIVVAADGIRSAVREALFNPAPPVFTGFIAWRGLVPTALLPKHLHESAVAFGQGHHFNRYLVRHGELLNFVAVARRVQWEAEGWTIPAPIDEFQQEFASFDEGTQTIMSRAVEGQVFKWGLFGRPWLEQWWQGRVVLLGDAAHPMLPFLGQGAANALEDAMILTRCLTSHSSPEQAFALYQRTRGPRARLITEQTAARHLGDEAWARKDAPGAARLCPIFTTSQKRSIQSQTLDNCRHVDRSQSALGGRGQLRQLRQRLPGLYRGKSDTIAGATT
jgi:2-polyprenyl-6-methoxyphenol hydroxylase-like FAD-dependent oxidoreductase